jgi:hypothetical protein
MGIKRSWGILMSSVDRKTKLLAIIWLIALSVALGCVSGSSGPYPTYAYPQLPEAVSNPHEVWVKCSSLGAPSEAVVSKMYCVNEDAYFELRKFVVELDSLVQKYENTINEINKLE